MAYQEGTIADGPNGPLIFRGGQWVPMGGPQATTIPIPSSPRQQNADARANEQLRLAQEAADRAASAEARANAAADRAALEWQATHNPDGSPKKIRTFKPMPDNAAQRLSEEIGTLSALDRAIGGFQDDYAGNTITGGLENTVQNRISSFGTPGQAQWWADFAATDNQIRNALFGASLTSGEKEAYNKTTITPSMDPKQVRDNLTQRRNIALKAMQRRTNFLKANGYDPDAVDALAGEYAPQISPQQTTPWQQSYIGGDTGQNAAAFGATQGAGEIPPAMQAEHQAYIQQHAGKLDPDGYVAFMTGLHQKYGMQPAPADQYRDFVNRANRPGTTVSPNIPAPTRDLSAVEQFRNNLVSNPIGAGAAGFADSMGFGAVSALAPDQMGALGDANPLPMALGQIGGTIGATGAMGKLASGGLSRLPRMKSALDAMRFNTPFTRSLATDAAYSGIYGANTGGDPLTSAALGAVGSAGGQGVGAVLGAGARGLRLNPQALALRARGIPMTIGQQLGGIPKSIEDAMTSLPGVGDIINARRLEGLRAFNQRALNDAGQPVGARVADIGEKGAGGLFDQISNSYDSATAGVDVPLDAQFATDLAAARQAGTRLPPDYAGRFNTALDNRVGTIEQSGRMTGDEFQQATRGIKGYRASAGQAAPGFEGDYRDALTLAQDALTGQMNRGGGAQTVASLKRADQAYRQAKVIEKAIQAAKNGSGSGEVQVFTPAQLNTAATQSANKFGGKRPFSKLIDAGQTVLPSKLPDSGTAKRVLQAGIGAGGIGTAYGMGADSEDAAKTAGVLALLMAGGTKTGQKSLEKLLIERPDLLKRIGTGVSKRKGLLGSSTLPFLIEN